MSQRSPAVVALGGVAGELAGGGELGGHVGQVVADGLMLPDRLAETLPLLGVGQRILQRRGRHAQRPRRHLDAAGLQALHHLGEALPGRPAEHRRRRHPAVVETSVRSSPRPCSPTWADPARWSARRRAPRARTEMPLCRGVALRIGLASSAISPERRALEIQVLEPLITKLVRRRRQRGGRHVLQVGAAAGFGQRHGGPQLAGGHRRQIRAASAPRCRTASAAWRPRCARPSRRPGSSSRAPAPG